MIKLRWSQTLASGRSFSRNSRRMSVLYSAIPRAGGALCSTLFLNVRPTRNLVPFGAFSPSFSHRLHRPHRCRRYTDGRAVVSVAEPGQRIGSPELVALEYADLNLPDRFSEEVGNLRIRQHVNPLSSSFMVPAQVPDWNEVYKDCSLPLMVDIGSGSGRYLMWQAKRNPDSKNYLGLEIRQKLVKRAAYWVNELALHNIHFIFANATISFKQLVSTYPGPLMLVSILCPDPHFKKKYHKRRVLQKPLVDSIIDSLAPQGQVFIQSDVLEVAREMRDYFDAEPNRLVHIDNFDPKLVCDNDGWLMSNPIGIRTEREIHAEFEGARIYRRLYQKII